MTFEELMQLLMLLTNVLIMLIAFANLILLFVERQDRLSGQDGSCGLTRKGRHSDCHKKGSETDLKHKKGKRK
jgi:hypothetical protein